MRVLPRQLNVRFLPDCRTGKEHNVLEVCDSKHGVSYVMAQDSEIHKELDAYKLRAHLLKKKNNKLEEELKRVSSYVGRLEARVEYLEEEKQDALKDAIKLLEELREEKQDEIR